MYSHEILLVEDDAIDADFFRRAIKRLENPPKLKWCRNGSEALEELASRTGDNPLPRLAIFDIKMPGMSGLELLKKVRQRPGTSNLPVIVMSSSDEPKDVKKAYKNGANSYVVKPNKFRELHQLVDSINTFWVNANRLRTAN